MLLAKLDRAADGLVLDLADSGGICGVMSDLAEPPALLVPFEVLADVLVGVLVEALDLDAGH